MKRHIRCRYCKGPARTLVSLGRIPLVNYFPKATDSGNVKRYPLDLLYCPSCKLGQTQITIPPENIFSPYHYITGSSKPLVAHLSALAGELEEKRYLKPHASVLDIGCNDGSFLSVLVKKGYRVLGVDPAKNIVPFAAARGVPVIGAFFGEKTALKIQKFYGSFDCITVTHTLANIPDLKDFFRGVKIVLKQGGTLVIEVASFEDMVIKGQIDAVYHEHYYYFTQSSLVDILRDAGLTVVRVSSDPAQGGSTRIIAMHPIVRSRIRVRMIPARHLSTLPQRVKQHRKTLLSLIRAYRGKTLIGFGAPAKAVTLLNWIGAGKEDISFIVDSTPIKHGRVIPGTTIPVYAESHIRNTQVDAIIILAWNYRDEIVSKISHLIGRKIPVIVPFPSLVRTLSP